MRAILLALCLVLMLTGCSNDRPSDLIEEEKYINLMVELQLLQSYQELGQADSTQIDSLRSVIFKEYDVAEKQFNVSHEYYQDHDIKAQRDRIGKAIEELQKDRVAGRDSTTSPDSTRSSD